MNSINSPTIYYLGFADEEFTPRTISQHDILQSANVPDGWATRKKCSFKPCTALHKAHAILHIWPTTRINSAFPGEKNLSVTMMTPVPRIYFNLTNIQSPPKSYTGSRSEYLTYIVQHELGHAIFKIMKHDSAGDRHPVTKMCSIMMQQTKGTRACIPGHAYYPTSYPTS